MKRSFTLLLALCLTMATMWAQDYVFTFNRTAGTVAVADAEGNVVEGVTATIAVSPDSYLTADKAASDSILCINQNSASATADNPNRYTLTIKGLPEDYCVENVAFRGVALTGTGGWQGVSVDRKRYFKVSYNEVALDPSARHICNDSHCSGVPTNNVFELAESYSVAGNDLVVGVDIYNGVVGDDFNDAQILGCFYGLTAVTLSGYTMEAVEKTDYTDAIVNAAVASKDGWTIEAGDVNSVKYGDDHIKTSQANLHFYQTITLPAGQYKMTVKAAYRYGSGEVNVAEKAEYDAIQAGTETHLAKLYAQTSSYKYEGDVQNRWEGRSETDYFGDATAVSVIAVEGEGTYYVPNSSKAVKRWFDNGKYVNELVFNVQEEGEVIIGIKKDSNGGDYTNISAWTLTRLGDAEADPKEEEPGDEPEETTDIDMTSKVGTSKEAWNATGGPVTIDGVSMPEMYETTTETTGDVLWQTVTGLENGTYTVELWANARYTSGRGFDSPATDGQGELTYLFANNVELSIPVVFYADLNNNTSHKLEGVEVTDGTLRMGMTKKTAGSNWHTIQIKSLTLHVSNSEALNLAKVDLQSALEAANAVSPATETLTAAIAAAQDVYDNSKSVDDVNAATATLKVATTLAINTNSVVGATLVAPIATDFVVNGTFDEVIAPWESTTGAQNQALATNQQGAFTGRFFENWNGSNYTGKIYQVIENIPNGLYELSICAFVETFNSSAQFVYANGDKKALATGAPTAYTVLTVVANNTLEIGFEQTEAVNRWSGIDNVSLKYFGEFEGGSSMALVSYEITKANAQALVGEKMAPAALEALNSAIVKEVDTTSDDALIAAEAEITAAIDAAKVSIQFFATNKLAIDAMFALMESTNVYTAEAFLAYETAAKDYLEQYEAGTLTTAVDNPAAVHGWHASVDYDDMLLSAFGVKDFDTNLYINTWSVEGGEDGSEFVVPFFEYWTNDDQSLGTTTKTATVTGLTPGQYYGVEAWVRVSAKTNVAAADATGITLSVGEGTPVDVTEGVAIDGSRRSHGVFTAYGYADAEGKLTINFNVLDGNNVSWLSFKNLKYAEAVAPFTDFYTNPSGEEELDELGNIELFFGVTAEDVVVNEELQATLTTPMIVDDEYFVASVWTSCYDNEDDPENVFKYIYFELEETYTEPGEYKLTIPEGLFTVNGAPNAATEVYFTVKEPAPVVEFDATIVGVTPAAGEVTELSTIIVQFSNDEVMPQSNIFLTDEAGTEYEFQLDTNHPDYTQAKYVAMNGAITAAGTYTLDCSQIDHATSLWPLETINPFEGTYSWTIKAVDDGIDHLNADADAVIYDIHGRRVEKMTKGLYIVNGKKVVIK